VDIDLADPAVKPKRGYAATAHAANRVEASITCADGKTRNLGRIDRRWWAPRAWFYRYVTFPRLKRIHEKKG